MTPIHTTHWCSVWCGIELHWPCEYRNTLHYKPNKRHQYSCHDKDNQGRKCEIATQWCNPHSRLLLLLMLLLLLLCLQRIMTKWKRWLSVLVQSVSYHRWVMHWRVWWPSWRSNNVVGVSSTVKVVTPLPHSRSSCCSPRYVEITQMSNHTMCKYSPRTTWTPYKVCVCYES